MSLTLNYLTPVEFNRKYKHKIDLLLNAGKSIKPDPDGGIYELCSNTECSLIIHSRYINSIFYSLSKHISNNPNPKLTLSNISNVLYTDYSIIPKQDNLTLKEFKKLISEEYIFIGTESYDIIIQSFDEINSDYIKGGLLHVLTYHYQSYKDELVKPEKKTLFLKHTTINEILGAIISVILNGKVLTNNKNRRVLEGEVLMNLTKDSKVETYKLVIEQKEKTHNLITFYRKGIMV
jgi:hypothetical protein